MQTILKENKKPIVLNNKFQEHIIRYCKCQYNTPKSDKGFFEGLRKIWAIRCGYDYELVSKDVDIYIANDMYDIICQCIPNKLPYLMEQLHREIENQAFYKPQNMTPIEAMIWEYRSLLCHMQIKEKPENKKRYQWIVKLSKPKRRIFNRILNGNGKYSDYKLITKS